MPHNSSRQGRNRDLEKIRKQQEATPKYYLGEDKIFDPHNYQTGLFDCFLDLEICCTYTWCPLHGWIQITKFGEKEVNCIDSCMSSFPPMLLLGTLSFPIFMTAFTHWSDKTLATVYQIAPENEGSAWATCFCSCCRACQQHREIVIRGRNPESEWKPTVNDGIGNVNAVSRFCIGGYVEKDRLLWPSGYGNVYNVEGRYHRPKVEVMGPTAEMKLQVSTVM